ncbi:hypothetical protein RJ640_000211 [Escallonia rubra]|uniref:Enoyl reductase (ER) domain-containing protein n=1 Tax=Escallonia rubra TaxID=112253 RepID=A0AA88UVJ3_9ASTE|nr:hypothetical protein RJ640_000211 [Escallonia rubra]
MEQSAIAVVIGAKKKWKKLDEDSKWVLAKEFVSEWGANFHPLSAKSVKEMVDEHLIGDNPSPILSPASHPVITSLFADLKILSSELDRLAASTALVCDICSYFIFMIVATVGVAIRDVELKPLRNILWTGAFIVLVLFVFRPIIVKIGKRIPKGQPMKESQFFAILLVVLVSGFCAQTLASGGVGHYAVQLAKLGNAHVTATCGARNVDLVKSLGADEVLDYKTPEGAALKSPSGQKYDAMIHCASSTPRSTFEPNLSANGKVIDITPGPGTLATYALKKLTFSKKQMVPLLLIPKGENLDFLVKLTKEGKLKTVIDSKYPLSKAEDAWAKSIDGHVTGKIIIEP